MSELEPIDGENWQDFVASPLALLVLGKSDCTACQEWCKVLTDFLAGDPRAATWKDVRFGKMTLDQRGLASYKRANPWLAQVDVLPYNILYRRGERLKEFAGAGLDRLLSRLIRVSEQS